MRPSLTPILSLSVFVGLFLQMNASADSSETFQTYETELANIRAARAELNRLLHDSNQQTSEQHSLVSKKIRDQANQLSERSGSLLRLHPTNAYMPEVVRLNTYGFVLARMLDSKNAAALGNIADDVPSCLFQTKLIKALQFSHLRASNYQSAAELGFAEAAIDAIQLGPESLNGLHVFLRKARTVTGEKLAEAILKSSLTNSSLMQCAKAVLDRKNGTGQSISIKFTAVDGRQVDLPSLKGKVVLLDFWRTDCAPCMSALPELIHLDQKYRDQGFEIIGISLDADKRALSKIIKEYRIPWPNYWDGQGFTNDFAVACGVSATPDCWLLDRNGIVQETGATSDLEKKIQFLISQNP